MQSAGTQPNELSSPNVVVSLFFNIFVNTILTTSQKIKKFGRRTCDLVEISCDVSPAVRV